MPRTARHGFGITTGQRFETGVTVTFSDGTARHFTGSARDALTDAAAHADSRDLRVRTISTPQTIYRDLHGTREQLDTDKDKKHRSTGTNTPEARMLGMIGRKDLLV